CALPICQPEHEDREEKADVAPGVDTRDTQGNPSAPVAEGQRCNSHDEQSNRREHQRRADNRTYPDLAMGAGRPAPITSATAGISVSGRAVPTAASRLPTAASDRRIRSPAHSTPLVNISEPARITTKLASRITIWAGNRSFLARFSLWESG